MKTPGGFKLDKNVAVLIPAEGPIRVLKGTPTHEDALYMLDENYDLKVIDFVRDGVSAQALADKDKWLHTKMPFNPRASEVVGRELVGPVIILTGKRRWT